MALMISSWFIIFTAFVFYGKALEIEIPECDPPNSPLNGGYGPKLDSYLVGDYTYYFCYPDYYLTGIEKRVCQDNGEFSGDTPVCDSAAVWNTLGYIPTIKSPYIPILTDENNDMELAMDGKRNTCTDKKFYSLKIGLYPRMEVNRIMILVPTGYDVQYEVSIESNPEDLNNSITNYCGNRTGFKDRLEWDIYDCSTLRKDVRSFVLIKPIEHDLKICEVVIIAKKPPTCTDPHMHIENGRLVLSRTTASLVCDFGYTKSPDTRMECLRDGTWDRTKKLYCREKQWEVGGNLPVEDFDP